jgi:GMP synthase-like glutamine amidotransferase
LAVEHDPTGHAALVGRALQNRGVELEPFRVVADVANPVSDREFPDPGDHDLVVVLGAIWSVYDNATIGTWIHRELDFVRESHEVGAAVLGVCFGGQVLSAALGGTVSRAPAPEFGWLRIDTDEPDGLPAGPWFQWHYDRFTVPEGATELARNATGSQAFRKGRSLGLQFHPEVDAALLDDWIGFGAGELRAHGIDTDELAAETARIEPEAVRRTQGLVDWFLSDVARL